MLDLCDEEGMDALSHAVEGEQTKAVESLLSKGARISDTPRNHEMPVLWTAILAEDVDTVDLLLQHGAHVAKRDKQTGENALELAERIGAPAGIVGLLRESLSREMRTAE